MPVTREFLIEELADFAPEPQGETLSRILQGPLKESVRLRHEYQILWARNIALGLTEEDLVLELIERARTHGYDLAHGGD